MIAAVAVLELVLAWHGMQHPVLSWLCKAIMPFGAVRYGVNGAGYGMVSQREMMRMFKGDGGMSRHFNCMRDALV